MSSALFGSSSAELAPGARNAVEVCLGIAPREQVALVADRASAEPSSAGWSPAQRRSQLGGRVGEDLDVVLVGEGERQRERDLVDQLETCMAGARLMGTQFP